MAALDLLGRRWALRILWELRHGPLGARGPAGPAATTVLPACCDDRLAELSSAGLIARDDTGAYALTIQGRSLERALRPLDAWSSAGPELAPDVPESTGNLHTER